MLPMASLQQYLVVGLVGSVGMVRLVGLGLPLCLLLGLVGLALWLVSGLALNKYHCQPKLHIVLWSPVSRGCILPWCPVHCLYCISGQINWSIDWLTCVPLTGQLVYIVFTIRCQVTMNRKAIDRCSAFVWPARCTWTTVTSTHVLVSLYLTRIGRICCYPLSVLRYVVSYMLYRTLSRFLLLRGSLILWFIVWCFRTP